MNDMGDVPMVSAATWSRACRRARSLSQRELADLAGVSRSTVDRMESGHGRPAFDTVVQLLAATGYAVVAVDRHGRVLPTRAVAGGPHDRAGRSLPAHLRPVRTLPMMAPATWDEWRWWGWGSVAWSDQDRAVPAWTYHHWRRNLSRLDDRGECDPRLERGRVWDDAT